ncbi:pumilio homolog 3-like [Mytilus californianus]|uniref:pumilio homolog 3-like n=1 Tax=Mytilus californianus TaxID=6549 RepID=UPI00224546A7|nr:pumilio homolog 3-like [Mytilus californianus]
MRIAMDADSSFEDEFYQRPRRKPKSGKQKGIRGNPEGDSIMGKDKGKLRAPPNSDNDSSFDVISPSKKRKTHINPDPLENVQRKPTKRHLQMYSDTDLSSLDQTDTPDTLSQISSIMPCSDVSMQTTFSRMRKPRGRADITLEKAVQKARGQPDGAERSFHQKKASKSILQPRLSTVREAAEGRTSDSSTQEVCVEDEPASPGPQQFERRKSMKVKLKRAASNAAGKLKSLKGKKVQLSESRLIAKCKMEDSQLEETSESKKTKLKELPFKERKKVRKMLKNNFNMIQRSKKIWEELRRHDVKDNKKHELCTELMGFVKGNMKEFAFAHDTARVLQCLVQHGSPGQKDEVFEEVKDQICLMARSKYAKFLVKKLIVYGSKQHKNHVFKSFHGNVRKLVRHREASDLVEFAYNEYANAPQRLSLLEDFYGPSFILFKTPDMRCLDQMLMLQPDKKDMILSNMKEALLPLIDKTILVHSMVHRIFFEFFVHASDKMRSDMIEALRESLMHMIHTRDGSRVAMYCFWYGNAKDRKIMIKSLKTHVMKICCEEYGHLVMLAMFDGVDDTKLVQKAILDDVIKNVPQLAKNQYGKKVLLYLLCPRDPHFFHPDVVKILQEADLSTTSKKQKSIRHRELLEFVSEPLLKYIVDYTRELVMDNTSLLFLSAIITHSLGDPTEAMTAIAKIASEPFVAGSLQNMHIVEHSAGHMALKKLIQSDKERIQDGKSVLFSQILLQTLPDGCLKSWAACNRGCFTLAFLLELDHPEVTDLVTAQLIGVRNALKKMTFKGAQVLMQKLDAVNGEFKL